MISHRTLHPPSFAMSTRTVVCLVITSLSLSACSGSTTIHHKNACCGTETVIHHDHHAGHDHSHGDGEGAHDHGEVEYVEEETTSYAHSYSGYTTCGDFFAPGRGVNQCHPGSYCSNATFSKCTPGCLSDQNCSQEQVCQKHPGQPTGTCQVF